MRCLILFANNTVTLSRLKLACLLQRDICGGPKGIRGMRVFVSDLMLLLLLLMLVQPAEAKAFVAVDDAMVCRDAALKYEKQYQIKEHMLQTITNVETGRWNQEQGQTLGWPWTVNAQGKGRFYSSKAEAVKAVKELQAKGVKSIDVGCMQINLKYHADAFESIEDAFDPYKNVEYGAKFLKKLYKNKGNDWMKAAMAYHSGVLKKALRYKKKLVVAYAKVKQLNSEKSVAEASVKKTSQATESVAKVNKTVVAANNNHKKGAAEKANQWREAKLREYQNSKVR